MIEKINVKESAFKFDPIFPKISLITGVRFVYCSGQFKLDANQPGEENLVSIENIKKEENKIEFSTGNGEERINFELTSKTAIDNLFFDLIANFNKTTQGFTEDLYEIELIFKNGFISALYIHKNILKIMNINFLTLCVLFLNLMSFP